MKTRMGLRQVICILCFVAVMVAPAGARIVAAPQDAHELEDHIAGLRNALAPGIDADTTSTYAGLAAWYSRPEEAASDEWRELVLQAIADPRTRPSFEYLLFPVVKTRFPALWAKDQEAAFADAMSFLVAVEDLLPEPETIQELMLAYCRGRTLRRSGKVLESLALLERVDQMECDTSDAPDYVLRELADTRSAIREAYVTNLWEVGLTRDAFRLARDKSRKISSAALAEVELRRGRPAAALKALVDGVPKYDRPRGRLVEGIALARLGNAPQARSILNSIIDSTTRTDDHGTEDVPLEFDPLDRIRAAITLCELEARLGNQAAVAQLLNDVDWSSGITELLDARLSAISAAWATETGQGVEHRDRTRLAMRTAFSRWIDVWKSLEPVPGGARFLQAPHRQELMASVMQTELGVLDGDSLALQRLLDAQSCGTLAKRMGLQKTAVKDITNFVRDAGGGLLAVLPLVDQIHVFAVDARGVMHASVPELDVGDDLVALRSMVLSQDRGEGDTAQLIKLAERLTASLLPGDLRGRAESWEAIRFVGLDRVTPLPPALLRTEGGEWLGCKTRVTEWPSIPVGLALEARPANVLGRWHAAIDPANEARGDLDALPFTRTEKSRLERLFGSAEAVTQGMDSKLPPMSGPALSLLYLHCHGELRHRDRRPGRLILASGSVSAADIENWAGPNRAPAGVILAACSAGRTQADLGEDGSDSISSAFFYSGASWVVAPRHEVFHGPTRRFALEFLTSLKSGVPSGEAARLARSSMIEAGLDPRDAAGLRLIGAGD